MNAFEYQEEVKNLMKGRYLEIPVVRKSWWEKRLHNSFFYFLEEEEIPVKVIGPGGQVYYFNTGIDKKKVYALMRELFPKTEPVPA